MAETKAEHFAGLLDLARKKCDLADEQKDKDKQEDAHAEYWHWVIVMDLEGQQSGKSGIFPGDKQNSPVVHVFDDNSAYDQATAIAYPQNPSVAAIREDRRTRPYTKKSD
jgi:hypothetical protein